jgi:hypothetical protein
MQHKQKMLRETHEIEEKHKEKDWKPAYNPAMVHANSADLTEGQREARKLQEMLLGKGAGKCVVLADLKY